MTNSLPSREISRKSIVIAAVSTIVEWYDFTLHLYLTSVLARVFFGSRDAGLEILLAGFAVTYCMRPLGAIVLSLIGDRFGRRRMLLLSMAMMGIAMLATALLPTRAQIGPTAGAALLLIRCIAAVSVGGEYIGVIAYLVEGAPTNRRGLIAASAAASSEMGGLLAATVAATTVSRLDVADLDTWGWRIPFLLGAALAGVIWLMRTGIEESPEFQRQCNEHTVPRSPLGTTLARSRRAMLRTFAISGLASIAYYVGITYVPTFLISIGSWSETESLRLSSIAAIVVILITPLAGALSDRFGRKPVLVALTVCCVVLPLGSFAILLQGSHVQGLVAMLLLAAVAGAITAVGVPATAEQFPGEGRLSGLAFAGTAATAIFGGLAPLIAQLAAHRSGLSAAPGFMIAAVALAALPVIWAMPETHPALQQR